jgi:HK97 family phage major capsid protein
MKQRYTGAMICFYLPELVARALYTQVAPALGEYAVPMEDYHCTLVYLPNFSDVPNGRQTVIDVFEKRGDEDVIRSPLTGSINGIGRFYETHEDERHAIYASFDSVDLPDFRNQLMERLQERGLGFEQTHGFVPHITVGYIPVETTTPDIQLQPIGGVTFDAAWFTFNEDKVEFPLDGDAYQSPYQAMKRYNDTSELPEDMQQNLTPEEQQRFVMAFNAAFYETQDEHKSFLAGYGAINRARVMPKKSANGAYVVKGWGILFTDEDNKDSWDTFFSEVTDLLAEYYPNAPLWMEHGYDPDYGGKPVGMRNNLEVYRRGVWVEHELHPDHPHYQRTVADAEKGIFAYSSDSIQHYMEQGLTPAGELRLWPLAGFSLVRNPAEPGLGPITISRKAFSSALKAQREREAPRNTNAKHLIVHIIQSRKGQSIMDPQLLQKFAEALGVEVTPEAVIPALEALLEQLKGDAMQTLPEDTEEIAGMSVPQLKTAFGLEDNTPINTVVAKFAEFIETLLPKPVEVQNFDAMKSAIEFAQNTPKPDNIGHHTGEGGERRPAKTGSRNWGAGVASTPKIPKKARANIAAALSLIFNEGGKPSKSAMKALGYTIGANAGWMPDREVSNEWIELFYAKTVTIEAGATKVPMDGIESLAYPKVKGGATAKYRGSGQAAAETQMSFAYVQLNLKEIAAATYISNRLLRNGGAALEGIVKNDLELAMALVADLAQLRGTGAKPEGASGAEPLGVKYTPNVTSTSLGTNGANPTIIDFVRAWGRIEDTNVPMDDSWGIVASPRTIRYMENQRDTTGRKLDDSEWTNGHKTHKTTQIPNNLTKGSSSDCSEIYLGAWQYLVVGVGMDIEFVVSTEKRVAEGETYVQAVMMHDCGVSHPEAFQMLTDVRGTGV